MFDVDEYDMYKHTVAVIPYLLMTHPEQKNEFQKISQRTMWNPVEGSVSRVFHQP